MNPNKKNETPRNQGVVAKSTGTPGGVDTRSAHRPVAEIIERGPLYAAHPGSAGGVDTKAAAEFGVLEIREPERADGAAPGRSAATGTLLKNSTTEVFEAPAPSSEGPEIV